MSESNLPEGVRRPMGLAECGLCGHDPACGVASATENDRTTYLCHADDHSCYHRWTVYAERLRAEAARWVTVSKDVLRTLVLEGPCPKARANLNGRRAAMSDDCVWCQGAKALLSDRAQA